MGDLVISDFGPEDISDVVRLARDYVSRTAYQNIGMDERAVALNIARIPVMDPNIHRAFVAHVDDRLVAFLYCERQFPWFNPLKSLALEQFYAVSPDCPADTSARLLDHFEEWAFSNPSTSCALFQSFAGGGREEAISRFMTRRGYHATEQSWLMNRPHSA